MCGDTQRGAGQMKNSISPNYAKGLTVKSGEPLRFETG
jgi:hypothetical protein